MSQRENFIHMIRIYTTKVDTSFIRIYNKPKPICKNGEAVFDSTNWINITPVKTNKSSSKTRLVSLILAHILEKHGKNFHTHNKQEIRDWVPMTHTPFAWKVTTRRAIYQDWERTRGDTSHNPVYELHREVEVKKFLFKEPPRVWVKIFLRSTLIQALGDSHLRS